MGQIGPIDVCDFAQQGSPHVQKFGRGSVVATPLLSHFQTCGESHKLHSMALHTQLGAQSQDGGAGLIQAHCCQQPLMIKDDHSHGSRKG